MSIASFVLRTSTAKALTNAGGGTVGTSSWGTQSRLRLMASVGPLITGIVGLAAGTAGETGAPVRRRPAKTAAGSLALRATRRRTRRATCIPAARAAAVLVWTRSPCALGAVRSNETRQLRLRLAIPDAVGTGGGLLMADGSDIGSIPADELAMRLLAGAGPLAPLGIAARRRGKTTAVVAGTPLSAMRTLRTFWTMSRRIRVIRTSLRVSLARTIRVFTPWRWAAGRASAS